MKRLLTITLVSIVLTTSLIAQSAVEIVEKSRDILKISSFEATSTLIIKDDRGNERRRSSTMASKSYPDGTEKRIIKFTAPADVKGTGTLIFDYEEKDDDMWVYLPALRQTRRIVAGELGKSYMGSEFSNSDMSAPRTSDFNYKLLGDTMVNNTECWQIESLPADEERQGSYGYSKSIICISKINFIVLQTDYYDLDGDLHKTIITTEYKLIDNENGKFMLTGMEAINHKNGRSSVMKMEQVVKTATNDQYFTVAWLEKSQ